VSFLASRTSAAVRERAAKFREHVLAERTIEANLWRWHEALRLAPAAYPQRHQVAAG
jgi:hypothetical protein